MVIESPDTVHTVQTILFLFLGTVFTIAILADDETSVFIAIFPFLIFVTGIIFAVRGGKTDSLVIDKQNGAAEIMIHPMGKRAGEPVVVALDDIESFRLESGTFGGVGEGRSHSTIGVSLQLKDGSSVQATPSINQKRKMKALYEEIQEFLDG